MQQEFDRVQQEFGRVQQNGFWEFHRVQLICNKNAKKPPQRAAKSLILLVAGVGFEPTTFRL